MKSYAVSCITLLISVATAALPNVTPQLMGTALNCRGSPTGFFMLVVDSAEDPAVNNLPAQPYDIIFPNKVLPLLAIDLRASRAFAKDVYRCNTGQMQVASPSVSTSSLGICQDRNNAHILIDAPAEKVLVPELYTHSVDGKQVDGVYFGVNNQTTWGFRYSPATCGANAEVSTRDYYEVKLLGLPESEYDTAGYEISFRGFLKVVDYN